MPEPSLRDTYGPGDARRAYHDGWADGRAEALRVIHTQRDAIAQAVVSVLDGDVDDEALAVADAVLATLGGGCLDKLVSSADGPDLHDRQLPGGRLRRG